MFIPARAHFDRHRHADGIGHAAHDALRQLRFAHDGRTASLAADNTRRTTKIYVDDFGSARNSRLRCRGHLQWICAQQLNHRQLILRVAGKSAHRHVGCAQPLLA